MKEPHRIPFKLQSGFYVKIPYLGIASYAYMDGQKQEIGIHLTWPLRYLRDGRVHEYTPIHHPTFNSAVKMMLYLGPDWCVCKKDKRGLRIVDRYPKRGLTRKKRDNLYNAHYGKS